MSKLRICLCCEERQQRRPILPSYTPPRQRQRYAIQSQSQKQTHSLVTSLVIDNIRTKGELSYKSTQEDSGNHFMRAVNLLRLKLSAVSTSDNENGRDTNKTHQTLRIKDDTMRDDQGMETDLDKALKTHELQELREKAAAQRTVPIVENLTPRNKVVSMEGQLLKFTNIVKGYQTRWFILNAEAGTLEYFENKTSKKRKPRGCINLQAAHVSTTGIDPLAFVISAINGQVFKLRAIDDLERQLWIERTIAIADYHKEKGAQTTRCPGCSLLSNVASICANDCSKETEYSLQCSPTGRKSLRSDALIISQQYYKEAEDFSKYLDTKILELPLSGVYINSLDTELLLLKATSSATLQCINDCISILQLAEAQVIQCTSCNSSQILRHSSFTFGATMASCTTGEVLPNPDDEIADDTVYEEDKGFEKTEDHKSVILHLLSQLKLGMDLSKVTLPTFILERRSLLEMFTDCMGHPNAFVSIPKISDPEKRFLAVLEWYLTSFHNGRLGTSAKKPYNPIKGETFHCSWRVPNAISKDILLTYTAEQVSHHPPVSAFYVECVPHNIKMNASIFTKSKFMGVSVGVSMVGRVRLNFEDHGEDYYFSLPSAYARSIYTVPWVELGDKIQLICEKTGYLANIVFHTKPFYGGKLHHLTAEAKNTKTGEIICKVAGEWNNAFEFTFPSPKNRPPTKEASKIVDTNKLIVFPKYVRPLDKQSENESRKLWIHVTNALMNGDVPKATEQKQKLENIQREKEEKQRELNIEYEPKEG